MQRVFFLCRMFILAGIVLFSVHLPARAQSAEDLLERLRDRYPEESMLQADFSQYLTTPDGERLPGVEGTLLLQGDRYRVDTDAQTFVTDGLTTWIYNRYEKQVLVNDYVEDPATFSLNTFLYDFDTHYEADPPTVQVLDGVRHRVLTLRPRGASSFFQEVTLWVRDEDAGIVRLRVLDVNEAELEFLLDRLVFEPELASDPFAFVPPDDAEVIDLRTE